MVLWFSAAISPITKLDQSYHLSRAVVWSFKETTYPSYPTNAAAITKINDIGTVVENNLHPEG